MELERDIQIVIIAHLDDENSIEPIKNQLNEYKIRFNEQLKQIPELYSTPDDNNSEYINGFLMKQRFIKSEHMISFTKEQDRLIEITEPIQNQAHIDIYKHYPLHKFDLTILSIRLQNRTMSVNDWWRIFKKLISSSSTDDPNDKQIEHLCAPAFNLPLPNQLVRQSSCLIKFYDTFKTSLFSNFHRLSSTSLLSSICHVLPAIQLTFRPKILQWFDKRTENHLRLKKLLDINCLCLVAYGRKKSSFQYDFSLMEYHIIKQFNSSEWELNNLVKRFAMKYLYCPLDNYFLRTSILWICEQHDLKYYHNIFEVWISFMKDVCRKRFLSHYFIENLNIYEEHEGLEDLIKTIDYKNIDLFVEKLKENLIFPYFYQFNDRLNSLIQFFEAQPVLALKMKVVYNVVVKSQFPHADCSLNEMCSIIYHLSFLEDDDKDRVTCFWDQQWKSLFIDFDRDDIVLRQVTSDDYRPDQLAQQMATSVFKLMEIDLTQMIDLTKSNLE